MGVYIYVACLYVGVHPTYNAYVFLVPKFVGGIFYETPMAEW